MQIIPSYELNNSRLESFLTNMHYYRNLNKRINIDFKKKKINIEPQNNITFEILLSSKNIKFYYIVPDIQSELFKNEFNICYPKAVYKEQFIDHLKGFRIDKATEFQLQNHYFMSLKVDKRGEFPLNSLLESSKLLRNNEKVIIQYILTPVSNNWNAEAEQAISDFSNGEMPKRYSISRENILKTVAKSAYYISMEFVDLMSLFLTNKDYEYENIDKLEFEKIFKKGLTINTKEKCNYTGFDTSIRIAVNSISRPGFLLNIFSKAYNNLKDDNSLIPYDMDLDNLKANIKARKSRLKINRDILNVKELAQLLQLPTKTYQEEYNIKSIDTREIDIPKIFTDDKGLQIGWVNYKGKKLPLSFPLDDVNSLCQCWLSIGKMGSGKSSNGENLALGLLKKGYSVFAVDVADGKLIDNIEGRLPKNFNKIIDLNFGDTNHPIPLSWSETALSGEDKNIETKLAAELKHFLNKLANTDQQKLSDRMERFLGACAKAVFKNPNANLYDVILCITNKQYRHKIIQQNHIEGRIKYTLQQLDDNKEGTKSAYISGIMDRLEALLDNEYVANCLLQKANPNINFRKWADEGYFVGIRVPKDILLDDATDLLVTYIVSKLWLAILTRYNIPEEQRKPCFLILDEPHQFPTVLTELYSIIREMRKWHLGCIILAHEFGDFKDMKVLLKSAGTNYFIYSTSKETYKYLLEELAPFTLEECLKTKWHNAIVNMRYKDKQICVMADMLKPQNKINNYKPVNLYGNLLDIVEKEIYSAIN